MSATNVKRVKSSEIELKDRLVGVNRVTKVTKGGRAFTFAAINLWFVHTLEPEKPGGGRGFRGDFVDGVRYTLDHFAIKTIILYTTVMSFLLRPVVELLPGFADVVFERGAEGLSWLMMAFGAGSLVSAAPERGMSCAGIFWSRDRSASVAGGVIHTAPHAVQRTVRPVSPMRCAFTR